jgi:hypothetical protein
MKTLILTLVLLLCAAPVTAAEVQFAFSKGVVKLSDKACTEAKVTALIKPEFQSQFRAGTIVWEGTPLALCWTIDPSDPANVFVIDETGDRGTLPIAAFKPVGLRI